MSNESMPTGSQTFGAGPPQYAAPSVAPPSAASRSVWDIKPAGLRPIFCGLLASATLIVAFMAPTELELSGPDAPGQVRNWLLLISVTVLFGELAQATFLPSFWQNGFRIITGACAVALIAYHGYLCVSERWNAVTDEQVNFLPEELAAFAFGLTVVFATLAIFPWREAWALTMIAVPIASIAPSVIMFHPSDSGLGARWYVPSLILAPTFMFCALVLFLRASGRLPWLWFLLGVGLPVGILELVGRSNIGAATRAPGASGEPGAIAFLTLAPICIMLLGHFAWLLEDWASRRNAATTAAAAGAPGLAGAP